MVQFDDTGIKNRWRREWTVKVVGGEKLSLFMRKILTPGVARCTVCRPQVNYSSRGQVALGDRVGTANHKALETL